jgi:hypothetical protein
MEEGDQSGTSEPSERPGPKSRITTAKYLRYSFCKKSEVKANIAKAEISKMITGKNLVSTKNGSACVK